MRVKTKKYTVNYNFKSYINSNGQPMPSATPQFIQGSCTFTYPAAEDIHADLNTHIMQQIVDEHVYYSSPNFAHLAPAKRKAAYKSALQLAKSTFNATATLIK